MVRLRGRPWLRIMYSRIENSFGANSITCPSRVTRRRMQSSTRSPTCTRSGMGAPRRISARMRAISSTKANGFTR